MQKRNFFLSLFSAFVGLVLLAGCTNTTDEYSRRPCHVVIDNSLHLDPTLASAMNAVSPGVFCMIQQTQSGGANFYRCTNNQGLKSDIKWTAIDNRVTTIIGMNNGIIVGYGNLDYPATFYAYDKECPNCFDPDALPMKSKPLTMDEKGHASCNVCKRTYDLNNRGLVVSGEAGKALTRYPANTSGPFGKLVVQ